MQLFINAVVGTVLAQVDLLCNGNGPSQYGFVSTIPYGELAMHEQIKNNLNKRGNIN